MNDKLQAEIFYSRWGQIVTPGIALASHTTFTAQICYISEQTE